MPCIRAYPLQGLDYIAAKGAKSFDDLSELINQTANTVDSGTALQEKLKATKLYLKGDYKVNLFKLICSPSLS